ncbi:VOC family protein [Streptomyces sp. NPDC020412]|uniref:VOC family protein n=1 Tax=Streptomyces sp. NPDC020412 TaxID=3365073 RepID=UPI00378C7531
MPVPPPAAPRLHHIAVQTADLANCVAWYREYFGCRPTWSTDVFSPLTRSRLPGIVAMAELEADGMRFHLFEYDDPEGDRAGGASAPPPVGPRFQHVCLVASSSAELRARRRRWWDVFDSGRFDFARSEGPTEVVVDEGGVESFYFYDVNGLEFEFTHVPGGAR